MPARDAKPPTQRMMGYFLFHPQVLHYIQQNIFFPQIEGKKTQEKQI
jgi:hypothetical protein